ncbi:hypothetical protein Bcop_0325 [Bacteroides coprosuis DSM 18011]|uniref:VTT domain-containing protein n=1 Tax=Bacteroides coprosuis DSM 18011 TaxID=679937 RepID=F3ZQG6_9BACE|nr:MULTISPECIES: VTT domain-containing protein [Bacteroides]EGJ70544.1 hypothetical protein Bcop_0325 [Bacteroides coprosuis DSM 18011]HJD92673.1 VTT domain-containing protein [Bacteroides coprosuis]
MDALIQFLIDWGYWGMFISAVLAGSVVPFSSEAVLAALVHPSTGLDPMWCLIAASIGNIIGSSTCFALGHLGKMDWLVKYFHMKPEKIEKMQAYLNRKSALMAFFAFLPIVGTLIVVALGFMRSNFWVVLVSMSIGKVLRYAIVIYVAQGIFNYF